MQVSIRWVFWIGVFPLAEVQMYILITLRDCSALLRSPLKVGGMGVFFASVGFFTGMVHRTSSANASNRLVKICTKHLSVYQFLESGMRLAPVIGFFFLVTTVVQPPKGFLKFIIVAPSVTTRVK